MIADTLAAFIVANTSFITGTDLFLFSLPEGLSEGIILQPGLQRLDETDFERQIVDIILFYRTYTAGYTKYTDLKELFNNYRGTETGMWSISSEVEGNEYGKDKNNRFTFSITFEIAYDKTL